MKKSTKILSQQLISTLACLLISISIFAQAPEKMSYQAVVRNSSNNLVSNQGVGMKVSIIKDSIGGTTVYEELYNPNPTTNANGLVTVEIGGGVPLSGVFSAIDWSVGPYFIKTETDPTGGTNYSITGTTQLMSVPYALHAKTADSIIGNISYTETDPVFGASVASGITGTDTTNWNSKLDSYTETDPVFGASVASGITGADTTNWNNKLDSYTETDPVFGASVASGITGTDTTNWNNKLDSYTETDPVFGVSVASGITGTDTTSWNNKLDSYTETDPVFGASVASGITGTDTANWNNKLNSLRAGIGINISGDTINSSFWTSNGSDIYNTGSGKVGIGAVAPTEKLEVNGKIKSGNARIKSVYSGTQHAWTDSNTYSNIPNLSATFTSGNLPVMVQVSLHPRFDVHNGSFWGMGYFRLLIDGVERDNGVVGYSDTFAKQIMLMTIETLTAGSHTVTVQWKINRSNNSGSLELDPVYGLNQILIWE